MPNEDHIKTRFAKVIQGYCHDQGMTPEAFADFVGVPRSTAYKWHQGKQKPGKRKLKSLCRRLGWNYDQFFARDAVVDDILRRNFLSFETLQVRFLQIGQRDKIEALSILPVIAALAYNHCIITGLQCVLSIDAAFNPTLTFGGASSCAHLEGLRLTIFVKPESGIVFNLVNIQGRALHEPRLLTAPNLNQIAKAKSHE